MSDNQPLILTYGADAKALDDAMNRSLTKVLATMDKMEARVDRFEKRIQSMGKGFSGGKIVNEINSIEQALGRVGRGNAGKALANVFDRSRLAVLETGAAKIPIFGSALADLGPAGLAAGVGVAAAAVAIERAIKFTEKAADIERLSEKLKLTTTQVQELGHVFTALNVPVEAGVTAISELRGQLTEYETNISKFGSKTFGGLLKISPEDLKNAGDFNAQLKLILDKYSKLSGDAQLAFAKKTGVDPEVLNSLAKAKDRYAGLVAEAHRYGLVIDADVVKRGAEANAKLKTAGEIISTNLTVAFADLAPVIVRVANAIADATRELNRFLERGKALDKQNSGALEQERALLIQDDAEVRRMDPGIKPAPNRGQDYRNRFTQNDQDYLRGIINRESQIDTILNARAAADKKDADANGSGNTPVVPGKTRKGPADHSGTEIGEAQVHYLEALERTAKDLDEGHQVRLRLIDAQYKLALAHAAQEKKAGTRQTLVDTAGLTKQADIDAENQRYAKAQADHARGFTDSLQELQAGQLEAQAGITGSLTVRQAAETQRLKDEQDKAAEDLATRLADDKAYHDAAGREQGARLIGAQAAEFLAQNQALASKQAKETADQQADVELRGLDFTKQRLEALEKLATTQADRKALAEQLLKAEQREAELQLEKDARAKNYSAEDLAAGRRALGLDFRGRQADLDKQYEGPIAQFADRNSVSNLGTDLQTHAVDAMDTLNKGLAEAIANGRSATDILKNLPRQFLAGLVQSGLSGIEGSILRSLGIGSSASPGLGLAGASLGGGAGVAQAAGGQGGGLGSVLNIGMGLLKIFGLAGGGRVPGSGTGDIVPARLTPGEFVVNERATAANLPILAAINAGQRIPGFAAGGLVGGIPSGAGRGGAAITLHSHYDMRGVSGDRQIAQMIEAGNARTEQRLMAALPSVVPAVMSDYQFQTG